MSLFSVSEEQIIDRLRFENPWWETGEVEQFYGLMPRRLYFQLFQKLVDETSVRRAVVLMGPRRVGKTVMLHHMINELISKGISPNKICFINIETPLYNQLSLEKLFAFARTATGNEDPEGWYVIFDEIQYLKEWEVHLKSLVDSYFNSRFIASGSAAAALRLKSVESGAGRFTDFLLPPLTFQEYIHLKDLDHLITKTEIPWKSNIKDFYTTTNLSVLNRHFVDYINFGGYPEVIFSEQIQSNPSRYIRQDIVDKVLLRDLPSLYGIKDVQELNSLFTTIAYNSGNEFSLEGLSTSSGGVKKDMIKRYIEYLEAAFLIKKVRRIDHRANRFKRDNFFKIYLTNPSLRSALFAPLSATDDGLGNMVETAIYAQWFHRDWFTPWYARWQSGEVDMVGLSEKTLRPLWALEIKWSNRPYERPSSELKALCKFCKDNGLATALVTTIHKQGPRQVGGLVFEFVPASTYAYTVGANTLTQKKHR